MESDEDRGETRSWREKILAAFGLLSIFPTRPERVPFTNTAPDGLTHVYTAASTAEAELVRQRLADAGFGVEFVPSTMTGVFGVTGNVCVHVHADEADEATAFLEGMSAAQDADDGDGEQRG